VDGTTSRDNVILHLYQSFTAYDWLQSQFEGIAVLNISRSENELNILVTPLVNKRATCAENNITTQVSALALETFYKTLPNISRDSIVGPNITDTEDRSTCRVVVSVPTEGGEASILGKVLGGVIGAFVCCALIAGIIIVWKSRINRDREDLQQLPPEVRWYYEQYYTDPASWSKCEQGNVLFFHKKIKEGLELWERMQEMVYEYASASESIVIGDAYAIYNPALVRAFITQLKINQSRKLADPFLFTQQSYMLMNDSESKSIVKEKFNERIAACLWNDDNTIPDIIPALHGTSMEVAWKICSTGFAALSSLDNGFYGKGIYFTTHMQYALSYFIGKKSPGVLISFVLPGNCYPVTEDPDGPNSLIGAPLTAGFNSHFAITNIRGGIATEEDEVHYDEIVISQEAQATPFMLLSIQPKNLLKLQKSLEGTSHRGTKLDDFTSEKTDSSPRSSDVLLEEETPQV